MIVFIKAGGALQKILQPDVDEYTRKLDIPEGHTIGEICTLLGINPIQVGMAFRSGKIVPLEYKPLEGETITLISIVKGG